MHRIVIVSNRLPFVTQEDRGSLRFAPATGGLVSGLSSYLDWLRDTRPGRGARYLWAGWPGRTVAPRLQPDLRARARDRFNAHPVFVPEEVMDRFYLGFCNSTIWPLFHYFPSYASFQPVDWDSYVDVNERFARAVRAILRPGDLLWVHDYHLMLLPGLLRARGVDNPIGFFLHIPFPSFELFRLLPQAWGARILEGLCGADVVGFHTLEYREHFLRCVMRLLGHDHRFGQIVRRDRVVKTSAYPMGIAFDRFHRAARTPEVRRALRRIPRALRAGRIVLSVDRLDYSKGILGRLEAYERLLERRPQWREKVTFLLVVVPSRIGAAQYDRLKIQLDEAVGRINGRYGTYAWTPVVSTYRNLPFPELAALYRASHVAMVTPLRDGMNLVAKEWVASRADGAGALVLSETAGCAHELPEAIQVNPNHVDALERALHEALSMPRAEARRRIRRMQSRLRRRTIVHWARDLLADVLDAHRAQREFRARLLSTSWRRRIALSSRTSGRRLLLLDYDGTLVPFAPVPELARPAPAVLSVLRTLGRLPETRVAVLSGRPRATLQAWLGDLPVTLVAEHGIWAREAGADWRALRTPDPAWKRRVLPILSELVDRVRGSFVEEKECSVAWHYRLCEPDLAAARAKELADRLVQLTASLDLTVVSGDRVVEVRPSGADKGGAARWLLARHPSPFVLAAGDDTTDEDMFRALPRGAFTIKIGMDASHARFNLPGPGELLDLLREVGARAMRSAGDAAP